MARAFCLLILAARLFGDEFIFWARFASSNNLVAHNTIAISQAMVRGYKTKEEICFIKSPKLQNQEPLEYLNEHKDELFDCFINQKIKINDILKVTQNLALGTTEIVVVPLRFIVEFKPKGATISRVTK